MNVRNWMGANDYLARFKNSIAWCFLSWWNKRTAVKIRLFRHTFIVFIGIRFLQFQKNNSSRQIHFEIEQTRTICTHMTQMHGCVAMNSENRHEWTGRQLWTNWYVNQTNWLGTVLSNPDNNKVAGVYYLRMIVEIAESSLQIHLMECVTLILNIRYDLIFCDRSPETWFMITRAWNVSLNEFRSKQIDSSIFVNV